MAKTKHASFKCNLCGVDSNTNKTMIGFSYVDGKRFTRRVSESKIHICKECIDAIKKY